MKRAKSRVSRCRCPVQHFLKWSTWMSKDTQYEQGIFHIGHTLKTCTTAPSIPSCSRRGNIGMQYIHQHPFERGSIHCTRSQPESIYLRQRDDFQQNALMPITAAYFHTSYTDCGQRVTTALLGVSRAAQVDPVVGGSAYSYEEDSDATVVQISATVSH